MDRVERQEPTAEGREGRKRENQKKLEGNEKKKIGEERTGGCWKEGREEREGEAGRGETEDRELRKTG